MPFHAGFFPVDIPFHFGSRLHKKLHFHLLELSHAEHKLPGYNFVSESFPYLCDPEGDFHAGRFLNVQEIHKDSLCGFGSQINSVCSFA